MKSIISPLMKFVMRKLLSYLSLSFFFCSYLQAMEKHACKKEVALSVMPFSPIHEKHLPSFQRGVLKREASALPKYNIDITPTKNEFATSEPFLKGFIKKSKKRIHAYLTILQRRVYFGYPSNISSARLLQKELDLLLPLSVKFFSIPSIFKMYQPRIALANYLPTFDFSEVPPLATTRRPPLRRRGMMMAHPSLEHHSLNGKSLKDVLQLFLTHYHKSILSSSKQMGPMYNLGNLNLSLLTFILCQGDLLITPSIPNLCRGDYFESENNLVYLIVLPYLFMAIPLFCCEKKRGASWLHSVMPFVFGFINLGINFSARIGLELSGYTLRGPITLLYHLFIVGTMKGGCMGRCIDKNRIRLKRCLAEQKAPLFATTDLLQETYTQLTLLETHCEMHEKKLALLNAYFPSPISKMIMHYADKTFGLLSQEEKAWATELKAYCQKEEASLGDEPQKVLYSRKILLFFLSCLFIFTHVVSFTQTYLSFTQHKKPR